MKTLLLCSLFCLLFLPALKAQTDFRFADSTAKWNGISWLDGMQPSSTEYELTVSGDTLVGGKSYQIIYNAFLRKDTTGKVYAIGINDSLEHLIYDFSKITGDTFSICYSSQPVNTCSFITVDSIDSVWMGRDRKRMFVSVGYSGSRKDMWIDGIGALTSYTTDPCLSYTSIPDIDDLVCFWEHGQLVYHNTAFLSCVADIKSEALSNSLPAIFPNPTTDIVNVRNPACFPPQTSFLLFDITGRMILQKPLSEKVARIELDDISGGLYLYTITSQQEVISSGKLVVQ